jgi:hypothetical protein
MTYPTAKAFFLESNFADAYYGKEAKNGHSSMEYH